MKTIEFPAGEHIRDATILAAGHAQEEGVRFHWNGEDYEFPKGTRLQAIRQEYTRRTGSEILSEEAEREKIQRDHARRVEQDRKRNGDLLKPDAPLSKAPESVEEAIRLWDDGEYIVTAQMGGLSIGYDLCIQSLGIELMRCWAGKQWDSDEDAETWWEKHGEAQRDAVVDRLRDYGFSGAQVGAATNLAMCLLRQGYREALARLPADRLVWMRKPPKEHVL